MTVDQLDAARSNWFIGDLRKQIEPDVLHELGRAFFREGRPVDAAAAWNAAAERDPNLPSGDLMLTLERLFAALAKGDQATSVPLVESITAEFAEDPHFHLVRGEQALRSRNLAAAAESFERAHKLGPTLYVTSLGLARIRDIQGEHPDARTLYLQATERAPDRARPWSFLGSHQFRAGEFAAALESFQRARSLDARQPPAKAEMARLSVDARDFIGARRWYRAALEEPGASTNVLREAFVDVLLELRLLEEARIEIEKLLAIAERAPLRTTLGYIAEQQRRDADAEKHYRRALELDPGYAVAMNNLSMLLLRTGRGVDEALRLARAARDASPKSALVVGTYACALHAAGDTEAAAKILPRAVQLNVADPWARYCYGVHLHNAGRLEEARVHLEGALILERDFPRAAEIKKLIGP